MYRAMEMAEQAIAACLATSRAGTLDIQEVFNSADLDLHVVRTSGGEPIWTEADPVHLSHLAHGEPADTVPTGAEAAASEASEDTDSGL